MASCAAEQSVSLRRPSAAVWIAGGTQALLEAEGPGAVTVRRLGAAVGMGFGDPHLHRLLNSRPLDRIDSHPASKPARPHH